MMRKEDKISFLVSIGVPLSEASELSLEDALAWQLDMNPLTQGYKRQFRLGAYLSGGPGKGLRKRLKETGLKDWKIDFVYLDRKVAVEVEGGVWIRGRHLRGKGFLDDIHKYNTISLNGFIFLRVTAEHIFLEEGYTPALFWIRKALKRGENI